MESKFCKIIFFRCTLFWHKAAGSFHFQPFQLNWNWWHSLIDQTMISIFTYLLSPCYASWHIGQRQVSSTLLCCWLFFLLCPRCILFPLFHFRWCTSMLFLAFLFFLSLLVSILRLPLSCLQYIIDDVCSQNENIIEMFEDIKTVTWNHK